MGVSARAAALGAVLVLVGGASARAQDALASDPESVFREANELARAGDYPKATTLYEQLARGGAESASLWWNWGQAAAARGATGEALWALLRARELDPGDRAVLRDIDRLRESANLDPAEIAPEPLAAAARLARRFRLDLLAVVLLALSLVAHAAARLSPRAGWAGTVVWTSLVLGLLAAGVPAAGELARPLGVVLHRGAPLLDAASPTAESVGTLREGEVVPILERSGAYVRVEDSSGARGWASAEDVRGMAGDR
jgi:tetratricopeptide (TPR) repeat protein